jgi:hypothetical protein
MPMIVRLKKCFLENDLRCQVLFSLIVTLIRLFVRTSFSYDITRDDIKDRNLLLSLAAWRRRSL